MRVEILQTLDYVGIGLRLAGEVVEIPDEVARQWIARGLMRQVKTRVAAETRPPEEKEE